MTAAIRAARRDVRPRGPPRRDLSADARRDVRDRPRPDRLRRAHRHDARAARRLRDVLELRRGRPPLGPRARRHDGGAAQARPAVRPHRAGAALRAAARTRSSCSPTTARRRARPSSSATATASTSSSSARCPTAQVAGFAGGDEQSAMVGHAVNEATGRAARQAREERRLRPRRRRARLRQPRPHLPDGGRAAADARGDRRAPPGADPGAARAPARRLAARPLRRARRRRARRARARTTSTDGRVEGEDPLAPFSPTAPRHLLRTDGFAHVADIMVGSFYDPELDEGCAFEELISFHGGLGGPQTRPFILHPEQPAGARRADRRRRRGARPALGLAAHAPRRGRRSSAGRAGSRRRPRAEARARLYRSVLGSSGSARVWPSSPSIVSSRAEISASFRMTGSFPASRSSVLPAGDECARDGRRDDRQERQAAEHQDRRRGPCRWSGWARHPRSRRSSRSGPPTRTQARRWGTCSGRRSARSRRRRPRRKPR